MAMETNPQPLEGAPILGTSSSGVLTVPATTAITLTWPAYARMRGLLIAVETTGDVLEVQLNAAGTADQHYFCKVTPTQPFLSNLIGVTSVWLYNPGLTDIVLDGAGKNGSCYAFA